MGAALAATLVGPATALASPGSAHAPTDATGVPPLPSASSGSARAAPDPRERYGPGDAGERERAEITLAGDAFRFLTVEDAPDPAAAADAPSSTTTTLGGIGEDILAAKDGPSLPEQVAAAVVAFVKPLFGELGAAVLGFGGGAVASGFFMGWQQSKKSKGKEKTASRQALADLATLDESEIQELVGELPAWLAFRDVERAGWLNKVLAAAWPYLDQATSNVIVAALDPILKATRPSFLTTLSFERFSFGNIPASFEGVKVYETTGDGSVEIDLRVFWAGDPDVVLGVRAAQDSLSVPVSLTEFECSFTLRLIFAPLLGVFPCFGALTIALMEEPQLDFDLRVVGGDVTLVPGLKAPLKQYILALIASWMVWPRCITVAIPGTGYTLPVDEDAEKPTAGLLHITVVGHDGAAVNPGEVGLQVRWPVADLLVDKNQSEARVKALPGGGMLSSKEITLPVEDPKAQLLCVRWYTRAVVDEDTGKIVRPEVLDGEASVVLDELRAQALRARGDDAEVFVSVSRWGPVPVAAELEPPVGADIKSVGGAGNDGESRGLVGRVWGGVKGVGRGVGGIFSKSASGVVRGYKTVRQEGFGGVSKVPGAVVSGYKQKAAERGEGGKGDKGETQATQVDALPPLDVPTAKLVRLRVRYQPLDDSLTAAADDDDANEGDVVNDGAASGFVASTTAASDVGGSELINGRYASRSRWPAPAPSNRASGDGVQTGSRRVPDSSTDLTDAYEDELDALRQVLREKEREIAGMRTERSLMEKELAMAAADRERVRRIFGAEGEKRENDASRQASSSSPVADRTPTPAGMKLEALKSAARQTIAVINAARALPEGDRRELDLALRRADSLVAKAAQVVRESTVREEVEAAAAEAELQKLKATIAAAKVAEAEPGEPSEDEDEDRHFGTVHSKSEVQRAIDESAHAEHDSRERDEEKEKDKAEFLEALDSAPGPATSDEEQPSKPR